MNEAAIAGPSLFSAACTTGETQYTEWEKEDEVSVYVSREKLSFAQVGLKGKEELWQISEDEEGVARYGARVFHYHEDSAVTFYRDDGRAGRALPPVPLCRGGQQGVYRH